MNRMLMMRLVFFGLIGVLSLSVQGQDAPVLLNKVKARLDKVDNYIAYGTMRTDVAFIKAPPGKVTVYYKKPDHFKLKRDNGISILPKSGMSFNVGAILASNEYTAIPSGEAVINGARVSTIRLLPNKENNDVVLTTLYIDVSRALIVKANTTTRDNGTFEMQLFYGRYAQYGLPDRVVLTFNAKDYKLPKGVTLDYETGEPAAKPGSTKGLVELNYSKYTINKGVALSEFN